MADLGRQLRAIDIPGDSAGEERSWRLIDAAFDELRPGSDRVPSRHRLRWLGATLLALIAGTVFVLTPAGAEVREWVSDAVDVGEPDAKPALTNLPAPGSLLIQTNAGTAIIRDDGSSRALGEFDDVGWSPHGLYVAAARGNNLEAITASGDVRWELDAAKPVNDPVWSPNEGFRVAYRSGNELRVVWGDGTNDTKIGPSNDLVPAWQPRTGDRNILAFADSIGRIRVVDVDSGQVISRGGSPGTPLNLDWTRDGSQLLVVYRSSALVFDEKAQMIRHYNFGRAGSGLSVVSATFLPGTEAVAALLRSDSPRPLSKVIFGAPHGDGVSKRTIFTGSGRLRGLTVAPNGRQVLVGWPRADQWLFIPTLYTNRIEAVDNIRRQFSEPGTAGFPRAAGWCCQSG